MISLYRYSVVHYTGHTSALTFFYRKIPVSKNKNKPEKLFFSKQNEYVRKEICWVISRELLEQAPCFFRSRSQKKKQGQKAVFVKKMNMSESNRVCMHTFSHEGLSPTVIYYGGQYGRRRAAAAERELLSRPTFLRAWQRSGRDSGISAYLLHSLYRVTV